MTSTVDKNSDAVTGVQKTPLLSDWSTINTSAIRLVNVALTIPAVIANIKMQ